MKQILFTTLLALTSFNSFAGGLSELDLMDSVYEAMFFPGPKIQKTCIKRVINSPSGLAAHKLYIDDYTNNGPFNQERRIYLRQTKNTIKVAYRFKDKSVVVTVLSTSETECNKELNRLRQVKWE